MSILDVFVCESRVLVAVDTVGLQYEDAVSGRAETQVSHISKMTPLVHLGAIVAYRGLSVFGASLSSLCQNVGADFDELLERAPECIETSRDLTLRAIGPVQADESHCARANVVLVGWSPSRRRMIARSYEEQSSGLFSEQEIPDYCLMPWDESLRNHWLRAPRKPRDILPLAKAQAQWLAKFSPGWAKGRLVVAEIDQHHMMILPLGDLV